jgi:TatD DNase family protein
MIDTHCHLTYDPLLGRIDDVLRRAGEAGVDRMITVGTSPEDVAKAIALAQRFAQVYAAVGLHPHYSAQWQDLGVVQQMIRTLASHPRVVAIGEMGLDRYYPDPPIQVQRRALEAQLQIAAEFDKPIIIHNRQATDDTLAMLRDSGIAASRFVFHCFTGSPAELDAILAFGAMVSFTGIVTFNSARELGESTRRVPDDRIMIETDSPYLTPEPHRKVKPNEPCFVPHVAAHLAKVRGISVEQMVQLVDANARRFFGV